ncbi:MAG: LCP family protein [Chloroflexi bacterium]|nr:LCP family protein [Chloroflexota bacterium]
MWALLLLAGLLLVGVVGSSIWLFRIIREMTSAWEVTNPQFSVVEENQPAAPDSPNSPASIENVSNPKPIELNADSLQPWSGTERVTILLLGIDQRCDESGPTHTDSMMLVTVDSMGLSAGVLSLPRDMWVEIPGFEVDRINQAHYYGEAYEYPAAARRWLWKRWKRFWGCELITMRQVNFDAFIEVVNEIGGIDVSVTEDIVDESYPDRCYGYDPFEIEAGDHHLGGRWL